MSKVARFFVGIDLHRTVVQVAVMDRKGQVLDESRFRLVGRVDEDRLFRHLGQWARGGRFGVEALGLNRWLVNGMLEEKWDVVVVDPIKLGLKTLGKKTDRRDALEIARRLRLGDIDEHARTYYPEDEEYGVRKLIRTRRGLVGMRQRLVNQLRGVINAYRMEVPAGPLTHPRKLEWLRTCPMPTEELGGVVRTLADTLEKVQQSIIELGRWIEGVAERDERAAKLRELPSVGPLTAVTVAYELGDMKRFTRTRAAAGYAGLVPRVSQSADKSHHGRLTKRGNSELRFLLGQWAVRLMTRDPVVQEWAGPRLKRMHHNKVRTALARRLLVGVVASERQGEPFDLLKCLGMAT